MDFAVYVPRPPTNPFYRVFDELAQAICYGLQDLGHTATFTNEYRRGPRTIVIGYHLLPPIPHDALAPDTILLNTEPIWFDNSPPWNHLLYEWAQDFELWDYSSWNIDRWSIAGVYARKFFLGFHPGLARIKRAPAQDIDVLFYGSPTGRRNAILRALRPKARVRVMTGVFGHERDAAMARSKIILNLHRTPAQQFEIVRCAYAMANRKAIVAEVNPTTTIDDCYRPGVRACPYEEVVSSCLELLRDEKARRELEERAYQTIAAIPQSAVLERLLKGEYRDIPILNAQAETDTK